jgi:TonB family protein
VCTSTNGQEPAIMAKTRAEIEELKEKLARNPKDALSHFEIGERYLKVNQEEEGLAALEQAVRLKPDFAVAHYRLGWTYVSLERYVDALKAHEQALTFAQVKSYKLEVGKAEAQHAIGWDYFMMKQFNEAISAYQKALQFNPSFVDALYEMGRVHFAQDNREEAMQIAGKLTSPYNDWLNKELSLSAVPAGAVVATQSNTSKDQSEPMTERFKPNVTYYEKAKYTELARHNAIEGIVVLNVVFYPDGRIGRVRVIRGLPYGLTAQALIAAEKIRFQPAMRAGRDVAVSGNLEFAFNLY